VLAIVFFQGVGGVHEAGHKGDVVRSPSVMNERKNHMPLSSRPRHKKREGLGMPCNAREFSQPARGMETYSQEESMNSGSGRQVQVNMSTKAKDLAEVTEGSIDGR